MAKEDKEQKQDIETVKTETVTAHKVKREVLVDKLYKAGSTIYLPDGKIKDKLISKNII